jgi:hypothetical protein
MAPRAATAAKEAPDLEPQSIFDTITVSTRAGDYSFREIDGETYDKCVELSTNDETKRVDMVQLLRWLTAKSAVGDNALDPAGLQKLPYKARERILSAVNELYFPDVTEEIVERLRNLGYTVESPEGAEAPNS